MEKFDSISHFLQIGKFQYRIFDMGRKVIRLSNQLFQRIEDQKEIYPFPFQQKAWLSLLFWEEGKQSDAVIWFLQFPIDELGFLKQESRDHFLIDLLEQAGKNIQAKQTGGATFDELSESPFAFKPRPERLAMFHAFAANELNQPASQYYQHTQKYLSGDIGYDDWHFLGLQGIADVVARLENDGNEVLLQKAVSEMPSEPLLNFCYAMENVAPKGLLTRSLVKRINNEMEVDSPDVALVAALVRALSESQSDNVRIGVLNDILGSSFSQEIEVIAAISGRAWKDLADNDLLLKFISTLVSQDQAAFNAILADLMMIPGMREPVLTILRSPDRSKELGEKLSGFMGGMQT